MYIEKRLKLIETAFKEFGITEVPGIENNPRILQYFREIGHTWVQNDETSWCSAFANWVCMQVGAHRSHQLNARSWLAPDIGRETTEPILGDIVVLWREDPHSWKGHVGFYVNQDQDYIYVLGGNQHNMVCVNSYSVDRLLAYKYVL